MTENLSGSLLIAHPTLRDPNFRRTILFLSQHSEEDGATGFILNRPLEDTISGPADLENVPVYFGGPVEPSRLVLASLQWLEAPDGVAFRMFVGLGVGILSNPSGGTGCGRLRAMRAGIAGNWRLRLRASHGLWCHLHPRCSRSRIRLRPGVILCGVPVRSCTFCRSCPTIPRETDLGFFL